jgi:kynureninase
VLGAAPGQTIIADSTTVVLYKLIRAALAAVADPDRNELVLDTGNFPTDRYLVEGIALEEGLTLRWIETDPAAGVTLDQVRQVAGPRTAVVLLSHIAYRSGHVADLPAITKAVHDAGALVVWDLCHSAGSVELALDSAGVDFAAGCTYKYLNGGPGSPAFAYVNRRHLASDSTSRSGGGWGARTRSRWLPAMSRLPASADSSAGRRRFSGCSPCAARWTSLRRPPWRPSGRSRVQLTTFAIEIFDALLAPLGAELSTPREQEERGSHITLDHPAFAKETVAELWDQDVIPDFRAPHGIRVGLSPLSTSFEEVLHGMSAIRDRLKS